MKSEDCMMMDKDAAKKLLAAAKIVSASMNEAAVAAKLEAERRAKEAALARRRAKEALEHCAYMVMKEKLMKKEADMAGPGGVSGSGLGGVGSSVGYLGGGISSVKMETESNIDVSSNNTSGSMASGLGPSVVLEKKINTMGNVNILDNSNVLVALNAVELRDNEKMGGIIAKGAGLAPLTDDHAGMDVDEKGRMRACDGENIGEVVGERSNDNGSDHVMLADMESGAETLNMQGELK